MLIIIGRPENNNTIHFVTRLQMSETSVATTIHTWMTSRATSTADPSPVEPTSDVLRLFAEHGSSLFRFCRFTLRGDEEAEDIVQDTFLKAARSPESIPRGLADEEIRRGFTRYAIVHRGPRCGS